MHGDDTLHDQDVVQILRHIEERLAMMSSRPVKTPGDWLTVGEAAAELKLSKDTIQRLIAAGSLKAAQIATPNGSIRRRYRIRREWLEELMTPRNDATRSKQRRCPRNDSPIDFIG